MYKAFIFIIFIIIIIEPGLDSCHLSHICEICHISFHSFPSPNHSCTLQGAHLLYWQRWRGARDILQTCAASVILPSTPHHTHQLLLSQCNVLPLLQLFGHIEKLFPELLRTLSDPSDEVRAFLRLIVHVIQGIFHHVSLQKKTLGVMQ